MIQQLHWCRRQVRNHRYQPRRQPLSQDRGRLNLPRHRRLRLEPELLQLQTCSESRRHRHQRIQRNRWLLMCLQFEGRNPT